MLQAAQSWYYGVKNAKGLATIYVDGNPDTLALCVDNLFIPFYARIDSSKCEEAISHIKLCLKEHPLRRIQISCVCIYNPSLNCLEFWPCDQLLVTKTILYIHLDVNLVNLLTKALLSLPNKYVQS